MSSLPDPTANHEHDSRRDVFDQNLYALGAAIDLPPAPTDEQLARWKLGAADAAPPPAAIPIHGRPRRRTRWFAAGSAMAATVAVAAVLFVHGGHGWDRGSQVGAATIMQSLRAAVITGINVKIRGLSGEGVRIDGDLRVRFAAPLHVEALLDDAAQGASPDAPLPEIAAIHAVADVKSMDEPDNMFQGLDVRLELGGTPQSTWAMLKSNNPNRIAESPIARAIMGASMNGIVVDFGVDGLGSLHRGRHDPDAQPVPEDRGKSTVSVGISSRRGLEVGVSHLHELLHHHVPHPRVAASTAPLTDEQRAARRVDINRHDELLRSILTGRAGEQELGEMLGLLQRFAADATVEQQPDGTYLLKVLLDPGATFGPDAELRGMLIRMGYAKDRGVQWAEYGWMDGVNQTGVVRIDLADEPIDPALLDVQRHVVPGRTTVVTPSMIKGLLGID